MRTFRDFMEASLYGDGGFYQTRRPTEDFYTAPELHPAFGRALAVELAARLRRVAPLAEGPLWLVEAGCGDGTLFRAVAEGLAEIEPELYASLRLGLVDRSASALRRALESCYGLRDRLSGADSLDALPPFEGVLYSNELLDALPFHLLEKRDGRVFEVVVDAEGRPALAPVTDPALALKARAVAETLGEGDRHAVCLDRAAWLGAAARRLGRGYLVTIDYGRRYPADAPVAVKTFRRHRLGDDPFQAGADITAPVDFEGWIREGEALGLKLETFETMASFLLRAGVGRAFENAADWKERVKLKTLIHPDGMGEIFKVLVQSKGVPGE